MSMPNMETRDWISRALQRKGKAHLYIFSFKHITNFPSFGWVNASYICAQKYVSAHGQRALGALIPWEQFSRAVDSTIYESEMF